MSDPITIIGAGGFIGRWLANELRHQGLAPWCPGRNEDLFNVSLGQVFYCAGLTGDYHERPFETVEAHVSLLARILKDADFESLVYLSSTRLYDALGDRIVDEQTELSFNPANPRHLYDLSKALGENLCLTTSAGRAKVVRLSCVLGNNLDDQGFVPNLLKQARGKRTLTTSSSPGLMRDYIGINDVVDLLIQISQNGQRSLYNVASGTNVSNSALFSLIETLTGCSIQAQGSAVLASPTIDISPLVEEFGFRPKTMESLLKTLLALN